MSTTDYRTLHVYRLPKYQKRVIGIDNYIIKLIMIFTDVIHVSILDM